MNKSILLYLCLVVFLPCSASAKEYHSAHFIIQSNLDSRLVEFVQQNAEAYYNNIRISYSFEDWQSPLTIYYSRTEADTHKLLAARGYTDNAVRSCYVHDSPAVYAYQSNNKGESDDCETLFYGITRHLIRWNLKNAPEWFSDGLSSFLSQQARIVKNKLIITGPRPGDNFALRDKLERGSRPRIKLLFNTTTEQFHSMPYGRHFARELFYWLHKTKKLSLYIQNVKRNGYEIFVLENTVSKDLGGINLELLDFLNKTCFAEAYLSQAASAENTAQKKEGFLKALELKPDYQRARVGLAKCLLENKEYQECKKNLRKLLNLPESPQYLQAAVLMGNVYYSEKDYNKALEYYNKAWEYSKNYAYRYRTAYRIANCYHRLKNTTYAKQWYQKFLSLRWNSDDMKLCADYARKYVSFTKRTGPNK